MITIGRSFIFLLWACCLYIPHVFSAPKTPSSTNITLTDVQQQIEATNKRNDLDEALKGRIVSAYEGAEQNLKDLAELEQKIREGEKQLKNLPVKVRQFIRRNTEMIQQLEKHKPEKFSLYPTDELQQRLIIEKTNLNILKSKINDQEMLLAELQKMPQKLREDSTAAKNAQAKVKQEQVQLDTQTLNVLEQEARKIQLKTLARKLNASLVWLDQESILNPMKIEARKLELELQRLQVENLSTLINEIDDHLIERRQQEIEQAQAELIQAEREAADKHPVIHEATIENIRYNRLLDETNHKLELYLNKKTEIDNKYKQLEKDYQSAEQKINLAGLSPALGNLLREQRRNLPQSNNYQEVFSDIQMEIAQAGLEQFQIDEKQDALTDVDGELQRRMSVSVAEDMEADQRLNIRTELRLLLNKQKEQLSKLSGILSTYSRTLADVDFALNQLVSLGEKYSQYLDERLLWVPSAPVIDLNFPGAVMHALAWLGEIDHWRRLAVDVERAIQHKPFLAFIGMIVLFWLFWRRRRLKGVLAEVLKKSRKVYSDRFVYTFHCLALVFIVALPLPFLLFWLGWLLHGNPQTSDFSHVMADGLLNASVPFIILQFFYHLFKPQGTVQSLFNWSDRMITLLYGQVKWIRFPAVIGFFLVGMFDDQTFFEMGNSLGRSAQIVMMSLLIYIFYRFAHPGEGLAADFYRSRPDSWLTRLRFVWFALAILMPLVIIGFSVAGYYQSALQLQGKLVVLLRLIFFAMILHEVVIRWLTQANRQMALQNARQKRKLQEQSQGKEKESGVTDIPISDEELLLDIPKINEQNRKLLSAVLVAMMVVGSWLILRDILPALSIFERVVLWQHAAVIDGQDTMQPITLVNVFASLLYIVLTLVFVKNFSGLVDLIFAGKYSMSAGSRYALVQLTGYTVITMAVIAVANELGGSWSQVQWLVAALGVGLGFGLQEIFANLVSGIILLFERPIRVGDTVTVGDVSGRVTHIQMRATTITDWDLKELVVPNKTFITEKLINWTLSDTITRVVIPVGISYDCDEELALNLFKQVFAESPLVLKEPEPQAFFLGFGDSSLDFSLRVYVRDLGDRLPVTDDIHRRVRRAFKEHQIEIPYPQRDLHIRSSSVLPGQGAVPTDV